MMSNRRSNAWWFARARLFFVSYAPLAAIYAARLSPRWWWTVGFVALAAWGALDGWRTVRNAQEHSGYDTEITKVEDQGSAVSGYLATYLLPFLGSLPAGVGDVIAYVIYFCVAFIVFVKSDLALINPTLYVLGWRVQKVTADGRPVLLVSREEARAGDRLTVHRFFGDVLIAH